MKMLDLFSGIGGISLAADWAGIETTAFCEIEPFNQKILNKHWPKVPIFSDIRTLTKQSLEERGVDVGTISIVAGGFPCQPYSVAGKQRGQEDDRDLWPEMFRVIEEIRPTWVVGENVANFANMELDRTLFNLESIGYQGKSFIIPACSVGAEHRRDRVFVVAYSDSKFMERSFKKKVQGECSLQREFHTRSITQIRDRSDSFEPKLLRNFNGIPNGVDRLRSLGNAVVPGQIYPIFEAIAKIEGLL
ncbi:TPA: DNA cytosine methyltransferase [Bacillus cereus]